MSKRREVNAKIQVIKFRMQDIIADLHKIENDVIAIAKLMEGTDDVEPD